MSTVHLLMAANLLMALAVLALGYAIWRLQAATAAMAEGLATATRAATSWSDLNIGIAVSTDENRANYQYSFAVTSAEAASTFSALWLNQHGLMAVPAGPDFKAAPPPSKVASQGAR